MRRNASTFEREENVARRRTLKILVMTGDSRLPAMLYLCRGCLAPGSSVAAQVLPRTAAGIAGRAIPEPGLPHVTSLLSGESLNRVLPAARVDLTVAPFCELPPG